ncbi:ABC transporter permease [Paraglaciecola aestuariivivens]
MHKPLEKLHISLARLAVLPILKTWGQTKYNLLMLLLQIALTFAVLSNGLFIVVERLTLIQQQSGVDEDNLFVLTSSGFSPSFNASETIQTDLANLRKMPQVVNAVSSYAFPYSGASDWDDLQLNLDESQNKVPAASYKLDEHGIQALGLTLVAGQNFSANEVLMQTEENKSLPDQVLLTEQAAFELFGSRDWTQIVGKQLYINKIQRAQIKGIVHQLQAPWDPFGKIENSIIYPRIVTRNSSRYVIRIHAGQLNNAMQEIEAYLALNNQQRMIRKVTPLIDLKKQTYAAEFTAVNVLFVVMSGLILVTALGIAGSASLQVNRRIKEIGIRRALGATKTDIMCHFITENLVQTFCGLLLGSALALGLNLVLVTHYQLSPLPFVYLLYAGFLVFAVGLIGAYWPARKAAKISPASATKTA